MTSRIEAERLFLRELEASDCSADYIAWLADPEVNRFLETRHRKQDEASIVAFIDTVRSRDDEFLFGIFVRDGDRHIGNIKVGPIHPIHRRADVSLFIGDRGSWGRGYASEAIAALSRHAFEALGVEKLNAGMHAANAGSFRAFLKAGYREEGRRRSQALLDGVRCDVIEVGLLPGEQLSGR